MNFVDQTEFSVEGVSRGNCLSACVASLLQIPLEGIPNFANMEGSWYPAFTSVLKSHGYNCKGSYYFRKNQELDLDGTWEELTKISKGVDGVFICAGTSPRNPKIDHAVLFKDNVMIHDPYPSRDGIMDLKYAFMIERF